MLKLRMVTALVLGGAFVGALFGLPDVLWALFLLIFIVAGAREWARLADYGAAGCRLFPAMTAVIGLLLLPGMPGLEQARGLAVVFLIATAVLFWLLLVPLWLAFRWHLRQPGLMALTGWLVLLPPWVSLVQLRHVGPEAVLVLVAAIWLADSSAYLAGKWCGRHKLAPQISPGKTWEGVLGALIAVAVAGSALCAWRGLSGWLVVGLLAITVLSVMGDLYESLVKRQSGKKDSGSLLPGHGGVLDRIDGLTSTLPLVAAYTYLPLYLERL